MKKLTLIAAALVATSQAQAASLLLDLRGDADSATYDSQARGANDTSVFTLHTGRMDLKGDVNEQMSYRFRIRFNNESVNRGTDNLSDRVDYAYLTHKMDMVSLTFGKMLGEVGGFETLQDSINLYYKSEANKALTGTYTNFAGGTNFFYGTKYMTGVKAAVKLQDSELAIMGFNNPESESVATPKSQTRFMSGAIFKGKFMDKKLQPVLSYHTVNYGTEQGAADSKDHKAEYTVGGLKWDDDSFYAQVDYIDLKSGELFLTGVSNEMEIKTTVGEAGLKMGQFTPKMTLESSVVTQTPKTGAELEKKYIGGSVALEYKPFADKNMRYHVAYTQKKTEQQATPDITENHVIVGFMLSTDLLGK